MKNSINSIPGTGPLALIIRHAERHPIDSMSNPFAAMLTEKGANDAFAYGERLSLPGTVRLYHSPVARCRETAYNIGRGLSEKTGQDIPVESIMDLGGPYIRGDWNQVSKLIDKIGHDEFIRQWFDGNLPHDMLMPLEDTALNQLGILAGQLTCSSDSFINVTHDWNILAIREWVFKIRHEEEGWPDFLDGIAARIIDSSLHLCYHGRLAEIPLDTISLPAKN